VALKVNQPVFPWTAPVPATVCCTMFDRMNASGLARNVCTTGMLLHSPRASKEGVPDESA
jgi:hypothetical protein